MSEFSYPGGRMDSIRFCDISALFCGTDAETGLLESEWVLRSYRLTPARILEQLSGFIRLPIVTVEHPLRVSKAIAWAEAGMGFADALRLAAAEDCEAFVTSIAAW